MKLIKKNPIIIFALVFVFWIASYFVMKGLFADEANEVGDSYGALNTLFSGFAFVGIIISIFMQSEELKLQRDEIKENRKEIQNQSKELARQAENLKISAELNSLNSLLTYYIDERRINLNHTSLRDGYSREIRSIVEDIKQIRKRKQA